MLKNKILFFCGSFLITFMVIYSVSFYQETKEKEQHTHDMEILLADFQEKFETFIENLLSKGIVTSEYFDQEVESERKYETLMAPLVQGTEEIYGISLLNKDGEIIQVYPYETNKASLGKVTQNLSSLQQSLAQDEEFWLSPPFSLYQGPQGFVLYIPIRSNHELKGWIAPVISLDDFLKKFIKSNFFEIYHLAVKDEQTGRYYLETQKLPTDGRDLVEHTAFIRGRKISFISWPRKGLSNLKHLPYSLSLALLVAFISSYLLVLFEQKVKVNMQLEEVESLLRQSIHDASNSFTLLQNQMELLKMGMGHVTIERLMQNTSYLSTMMEQIKALQKMANKEESLRLEAILVSEFLVDLNIHFQEKLQDSNVHLHLNPQEFLGVEVLVNKWLFINSVLFPLVQYAIQISPPGSTLELSYSRKKHFHIITLRNSQSRLEATKSEPRQNDKTLVSIKRVMLLMQGDLIVEGQRSEEVSYALMIPVTD